MRKRSFLGMVRLFQKSEAYRQLFTDHEKQILELIAVGYNDNEIAELLHTSQRSIKKCESSVLKKMNTNDISSAVKSALEKELISITYA